MHAPPLAELEAAGQLHPIRFSVNKIVDGKGLDDVRPRTWVWSPRFEGALPVVKVIKRGQIERDSGMGLNAVSKLESDQFLRIDVPAAKLRDENWKRGGRSEERRVGKERRGRGAR